MRSLLMVLSWPPLKASQTTAVQVHFIHMPTVHIFKLFPFHKYITKILNFKKNLLNIVFYPFCDFMRFNKDYFQCFVTSYFFFANISRKLCIYLSCTSSEDSRSTKFVRWFPNPNTPYIDIFSKRKPIAPC